MNAPKVIDNKMYTGQTGGGDLAYAIPAPPPPLKPPPRGLQSLQREIDNSLGRLRNSLWAVERIHPAIRLKLDHGDIVAAVCEKLKGLLNDPRGSILAAGKATIDIRDEVVPVCAPKIGMPLGGREEAHTVATLPDEGHATGQPGL